MERFVNSGWFFRYRFVCLLFVGVFGCAERSPEKSSAPADLQPWFQEITRQVGLEFTHDPGDRTAHEFFMPSTVGSGAAVLDVNNDGRLDILLLQNGGEGTSSTNALFRQTADGRFEDVSQGSGLDFSARCMGIAAGDVNNDGWCDVFISGYGRSWLFLNQADGTFADITAAAGLENPHWGTSAAFVDYDRDGWLDLVLVNYVEYEPTKICYNVAGKPDFCSPSSFLGAVTRLFRNLGATMKDRNSVHFADETSRSGIGTVRGPGLGVVCADFNGDGWADILVANDGAANHLWINQTNGTFREEGVLAAVAYNGAGKVLANMGVAVGDLDGDGLFELFITHLPAELNVCWKQSAPGIFSDSTAPMGLANTQWRGTGFGTVFGDFDQDGGLDIAVANGGVRLLNEVAPQAGADFWGRYAERNQLFANDGSGKFRDISDSDPFCREAAVSRGLLTADFDGDGALDLLVTRIGASAQIFRNVASPCGHWLLVRAIDPAQGGRDSYGATIIVEARGRRFHRLINPGQSFCCSGDPRAHFGLGDLDRVDFIHVLWPEGGEERFDGGGADQQLVLRKGTGRAAP